MAVDAARPAAPGLLRRMLTAKGRSLEITKAGWLFITLTIAVGFAAINSGSNLLHALFGAQITLIIVSGALSEFVVRNAHVSLRAGGRIHAEAVAVFEIRIENRSRHQPLLAVTVESNDLERARGELDGIVAFTIPAGASVQLQTRGSCPARGLHPLPDAVVATRFPFGLFVKRRFLSPSNPTLIFPALLPQASLLDTSQLDQMEGHIGQTSRGRYGDIYELREHRESSLPNSINWPASARTGTLVVCEYEDETRRAVVLTLPEGTAEDPGFERRVSQVATEVVAATREHELEVGLRYGSRLVFPPGSGRSHTDGILGFLATVGMEGAPG